MLKIISLSFLCAVSSLLYGQFDNGVFTNCHSENNDWALHAPDPNNLDHTPIKTIPLYFHFIRNSDCKNNIDDKTYYTVSNYSKDLENAINQRLALNDSMKAPIPDDCNSTYISDTRISQTFKLALNPLCGGLKISATHIIKDKAVIPKDLRLNHNIIDIRQIQKVLTCQYTDDNMQIIRNFAI